MASAEESNNPQPELKDDKPLLIRIPSDMKKYNTNFQLLAYTYQEKLLETCAGKLTEKNTKQINDKLEELINDLLK